MWNSFTQPKKKHIRSEQGSKASDVALSWTEVFFWDEYGT